MRLFGTVMEIFMAPQR